MIKLSSKTSFYVVAAATGVIAATVAGAGLLMLTPTGEQSKLKFDTDLWCVSNFVEQEPQQIVRGRPRQDIRLDGKESWIRREQVKAKSKAEAESKVEAQYGEFFTRSNKTELRAALDKKDRDFFIHHYNGADSGSAGATVPGPCEGSGDPTNDLGVWLADAVRQECFPQLAGNCQTRNNQISLVGWGTLDMPRSGKIVQESHLVTQEESFQPTSSTDQLQRHFSVTAQAIGKNYTHNDTWTPAEGGGKIGQGNSPRPPAAVEPWVMNMYWVDTPPAGTRVILHNPDSGQTVVAAAGYEKGPTRDKNNFLLGAQTEVMQALGAVTGDTIQVGIAEDQNLLFGPIDCQAIAKKQAAPKDPRCPKDPPAAGPMAGEDYRSQIAQAYQDYLQSQLAPSDILEPSESGNNGIPLFRQTDSRWATKSYGCGKTIGSSGCGVTAAAMVLKNYGINVDPPAIAQYSLANGHRICNQGTAYSLFPALANKYGLQHQSLGWSGVLEALKQGRPVIAAMDDNEFSSGGHFIVLTGISSDGKILINDPGPRKIGSAPMNTVRSRLKHADLIYK